MFKVETNIQLSVKQTIVYDLLLDVENYPAVFPFYIETKELAHNIWAIKALMNNGIFTTHGKPFEWETRFLKDDSKHLIMTDELGAKFPLKRLIASWEIINNGKCTEIVLSHQFEIVNFAFTKYLFYPAVYYVIAQNSKRLLSNIALYINQND